MRGGNPGALFMLLAGLTSCRCGPGVSLGPGSGLADADTAPQAGSLDAGAAPDDGGSPPDGGTRNDGGSAASDGGVTDSGGAALVDGGSSDLGGVALDAGICAGPAFPCAAGCCTPSSCGNTLGLQAGAPWPMFGRCPTRISRFDGVGPATVRMRWAVTVGEVVSAPTIDREGNIYVGVKQGPSVQGGLVSLDPDGGVRWFFETGSEDVLSGAIVTADGSIFSVTSGGTAFELGNDGGVLWTLPLGHRVIGPSLVGPDGTRYVSDDDGFLHALSPAGTQAWTMSLGLCDARGGPTQGADGRIWVGCSNILYAVEPDGGGYLARPEWYDIEDAPAVGPNGTVWVGNSDGSLQIYSEQGTLIATQFFSGPTQTSNGQFFNGPAVGPGGTVYFPSSGFSSSPYGNALCQEWTDGGSACASVLPGYIQGQIIVDAQSNLYLVAGSVLLSLAADGSTRWSVPLSSVMQQNSSIMRGMAMGADGTLYLGTTTDDTLYAFGP